MLVWEWINFSQQTLSVDNFKWIPSFLWSYHWLFVSIYHSMFSFWCEKCFSDIFIHCTHFYFHGINPLHSVMFLCFCKVPHNFQFIEPRLWIFECSKPKIIIHLQEHQFHIYWWTKACHHLREYLKTTSNRSLRCSYVNLSMKLFK